MDAELTRRSTADYSLMNLFSKITAKLHGRTTAFLVGFFLSGHIMQAFHRLDASYIAFMGTLMTFVLGHSIKDDHAPDTSTPPPPVQS